jgi:N,N'-diacetyllegionaminate synthase
LVAHAKKCGIMFLSTPFDNEAVDVLDKAGVAAFKIASYEMTDDPLLRYIARKGKPIIISTGMSYLEEVAHAVRVIQEEGNNQIIVLHCISIYPPKSFADLNLRAITSLREALKLPIGYSDHSAPPFLAAPLAARTLGACVLEKHFTDNRSAGSADDPNSMEPSEFKRMVEEIRNLELSISGSGIKQPISIPPHTKGDEIYDRWARRSLYAAVDIKAGTVVTEKMISVLRPYGGILPQHINLVVGHKIVKNIKARDPLTWDHFLN